MLTNKDKEKIIFCSKQKAEIFVKNFKKPLYENDDWINFAFLHDIRLFGQLNNIVNDAESYKESFKIYKQTLIETSINIYERK